MVVASGDDLGVDLAEGIWVGVGLEEASVVVGVSVMDSGKGSDCGNERRW